MCSSASTTPDNFCTCDSYFTKIKIFVLHVYCSIFIEAAQHRTAPPLFNISMLRSSITGRLRLSVASVSASLISKKQSSFYFDQTLLGFLHNSPLPFVSRSITLRNSGPVLCSPSLRFDHTMANQSEPKSVHDFTVKVILFYFSFLVV